MELSIFFIQRTGPKAARLLLGLHKVHLPEQYADKEIGDSLKRVPGVGAAIAYRDPLATPDLNWGE